MKNGKLLEVKKGLIKGLFVCFNIGNAEDFDIRTFKANMDKVNLEDLIELKKMLGLNFL